MKKEGSGISDRELDGKVAIITGAGRGIGAAIARELASVGAAVALAARSEDQLAAVRNSLPDGARSIEVPTDVSVNAALDVLVTRTAAELGGIDILVNNAGTMPRARQIHKVPEEEWLYTMGVNLHAPWYLANRTREHMKARGGGVIVNVSSNSGLHHDIGLGLYGISKAALIWLSTVQAKEWARDGIRVNCLAPGVIRTELAHDVIGYLEEHDAKPNPLNLIADPEDIAGLVRFIASPRARYLTGETIRIDGGELL
jgi:NAD(P)-dependent dehydrogenase (short-subunit alcohol dehydrogenase family)